MTPDDIDVGLPGDQIMQRWLARRIFRETEFCVQDTNGKDVVGFITGFDSRCLQISTSPGSSSEEPRSVLIFWPVCRIEETGRRIEDIDPENRSRIRGYSYALRSTCESVLSARKKNRPSENRNT